MYMYMYIYLFIYLYIDREAQAVVTDSLARTLLLLAIYIHHLLQHHEALYFAHTVCLRTSYDSHNKQ